MEARAGSKVLQHTGGTVALLWPSATTQISLNQLTPHTNRVVIVEVKKDSFALSCRALGEAETQVREVVDVHHIHVLLPKNTLKGGVHLRDCKAVSKARCLGKALRKNPEGIGARLLGQLPLARTPSRQNGVAGGLGQGVHIALGSTATAGEPR
jgi:hypothetical protein